MGRRNQHLFSRGYFRTAVSKKTFSSPLRERDVNYLYTFFQSNLLEWCIYLPFLAVARPQWRWFDRAMFVTALNAITHPIVFFFIMNLKLPYLANILMAETFAVVAEALLICWFLKTGTLRSLWISLVANLISWQLAPMLTYAVWAR